jgi:hypothetical protein
VWVYEMIFATRSVAVEAFSAPSFPLFRKGTAQEGGGVTTIQVEASAYVFLTDSIALNFGNVSAVIVKSQDLNITYAQGTDYSLDAVDGIVTRIASGGIEPSATVIIGHAHSDIVTALASGGNAPFAPNN